MTQTPDSRIDVDAIVRHQGLQVSAMQLDAFGLGGEAKPMDPEGSVWRLPGYEVDELVSTRTELLQADPTGGAFADPPSIIVGGLWAAAIHGAIWNPIPMVHVRTGFEPVDSPLLEIDRIPAEMFTPIRVKRVPVLTLLDTYRWVVLEWPDPVNTGRWVDDLVRDGTITLAELDAATPNGGECASASEFREEFLDDVGNW